MLGESPAHRSGWSDRAWESGIGILRLLEDHPDTPGSRGKSNRPQDSQFDAQLDLLTQVCHQDNGGVGFYGHIAQTPHDPTNLAIVVLVAGAHKGGDRIDDDELAIGDSLGLHDQRGRRQEQVQAGILQDLDPGQIGIDGLQAWHDGPGRIILAGHHQNTPGPEPAAPSGQDRPRETMAPICMAIWLLPSFISPARILVIPIGNRLGHNHWIALGLLVFIGGKMIMESSRLPTLSQNISVHQMLSNMTTSDLIKEYDALRQAQRNLAIQTGKISKSKKDEKVSFTNTPKEQMIEELMLENLKVTLGKPTLLGKQSSLMSPAIH